MSAQFAGTPVLARLVVAAGVLSAVPACAGEAADSAGGTATQNTPPAGTTTLPVEGSDGARASMRIRLSIGDREATATLRDNATARDFASLLPVTLEMGDLFGREKPGQLPRVLAEGGDPQFTYQVGDIAYWAPSHDLALFYAEDGQRIPSPGLVMIGSIDSGLDVIASAGNDFEMTIERVD